MTLFSKKEIARRQLETAVWMLLNDKDPFSIITLAGASGEILHQILIRENKQPFIEYARNVCNKIYGYLPSRTNFLSHIRKSFGINELKHHGPQNKDEIELDAISAAERAVTKAVIDYIKLYGETDDFIRAFLQWTWQVKDGPKMVREYEEAVQSGRVDDSSP